MFWWQSWVAAVLRRLTFTLYIKIPKSATSFSLKNRLSYVPFFILLLKAGPSATTRSKSYQFLDVYTPFLSKKCKRCIWCWDEHERKKLTQRNRHKDTIDRQFVAFLRSHAKSMINRAFKQLFESFPVQTRKMHAPILSRTNKDYNNIHHRTQLFIVSTWDIKLKLVHNLIKHYLTVSSQSDQSKKYIQSF